MPVILSVSFWVTLWVTLQFIFHITFQATSKVNFKLTVQVTLGIICKSWLWKISSFLSLLRKNRFLQCKLIHIWRNLNYVLVLKDPPGSSSSLQDSFWRRKTTAPENSPATSRIIHNVITLTQYLPIKFGDLPSNTIIFQHHVCQNWAILHLG